MNLHKKVQILKTLEKVVMLKSGIISSVCSVGKINSNFSKIRESEASEEKFLYLYRVDVNLE